ncbi:small secreted protein [Kitasatospora aureofaciens]|uniref:small secreted protein n=1 Tax=Kitasatospora aureofaciens TaxID=1894 RepID=UPI001C439DE7|nr:small secreted protein [Kitasatospora aureofaciens]MBV6696981.1 small secreted protein [Kitasatospora aureofaciens]
MNKRLLAVPALGVLLAFGAVGCGDDNSKQLESWASNVCGSAKDPIAQAQTALADTGQVKTGEAPADLQKRLSTDIGRLAKTNQDIAQAIDAAGAPKVTDGANLQKDTVAELNKAADGYLDVQKKLDALPNTDQAKFADGLRSVADQVQQLASLSTQAQAKLQRGELGAAMAKQDGCKPGASTAPSGGASAGTSGSATGTPAPGATGTPTGAPSGTPSAGATGTPGGTPAPSVTGSGSPAATPSAAPSTPAPSAS